MDYPKSVPSVGLLDGRFVDENPVAGTPGSLIPAVWGNAVTEEILSVINGAGLTPAEGDNRQLLKALRALLALASPMATAITNVAVSKALTASELGLVLVDATNGATTISLPPADGNLGVRDVIVRRLDNSSSRLVVRAAGTDKVRFHTHLAPAGYPFLVLMGSGDWWHLRSDGAGNWWPIGRFDSTPLGRIAFETTALLSPGGYGPLNGAVFSRSDWPWLWDHAQQSGALTSEAARAGAEGGWTSGDGSLTFRGPEGRGEFIRLCDEGRGADPARSLGSWQIDLFRSHRHELKSDMLGVPVVSAPSGAPDALFNQANFSLGFTENTGGAETRPRNIAYTGRIKLI
ncbi:phage tail protein [Pseudomonas hamedanensis]|uniref:Phage tail protein n=1 Tax=Pseudomonas hamedanensis TaxID=2745504 RepID=A0A9E6P4M1_9PSED|nr:phage tail protein [Pseudomonas hamedanensis]QXI19621.1 phage tail protein [Pseudomonas hamedanensis]